MACLARIGTSGLQARWKHFDWRSHRQRGVVLAHIGFEASDRITGLAIEHIPEPDQVVRWRAFVLSTANLTPCSVREAIGASGRL